MTPAIDSPTGLDIHPRPPVAVRVRKAVGVAAVIALGIFAMVIVYGIYDRQHRQVQASSKADTERKATPATSASNEFTSKIPAGDVAVAKPVPSLEEQKSNAAPGTDNARPVSSQGLPAGSRPRIHSTAAPSLPLPYQPRTEGAEDRERELAYQREQEAIDAPTSIAGGGRTYSGNTNPVYVGGAAPPSTSIPQPFNGAGAGGRLAGLSGGSSGMGLAGMSPAAEYNAQNGQDDKTAFIAQARNRMSESYLKSVRTAPLSKFEIKAGWDIPCTLEQALNSDEPGEIKALVRENVCDTATGKYVLLPQGSRLVGSYNSVISYGQDGIQTIWDRVIFPDGSSLNLGGMIGQDAKGQSGLRYAVNHHYGRLIGFAVLTSLFSAGFELSQSRRGSILAVPSAGEVVGSAVGREISQLGVEITRRNLNVQPTIKVPAGYRFNVRVNRDIVFDAPYSPFH
jgi:type IV secretory pathway VirB10-like protein